MIGTSTWLVGIRVKSCRARNHKIYATPMSSLSFIKVLNYRARFFLMVLKSMISLTEILLGVILISCRLLSSHVFNPIFMHFGRGWNDQTLG